MMRYYIINMLQRTSTARYTGSIQRARKQQKNQGPTKAGKPKKQHPLLPTEISGQFPISLNPTKSTETSARE